VAQHLPAGGLEPGPPDPAAPSYRRLLISGGRAAGAIVVGHHPELIAAATAAVKNQAVIDAATLARLRAGDSGALKDAGRAASPTEA
jgi:hypothetical protein